MPKSAAPIGTQSPGKVIWLADGAALAADPDVAARGADPVLNARRPAWLQHLK
jgi:hypothetical protein